MPPGPLPVGSDQRRRRNAPTIPTRSLPAGGRRGRPPTCPYDLGEHGSKWWKWAYATPQAAAWSRGDLYVIARRARIEDEVAALRRVEGGIDLFEFLRDALVDELDADDEAALIELANERLEAALKSITSLLKHVTGLAANELAVVKEARELDDRLGLTPKGMAALRWEIVDDAPVEGAAGGPAAAAASGSRARLHAVETG